MYDKNEITYGKRVKISLNVPVPLLKQIDSMCSEVGCSRTSALLYYIYKGIEIENEFSNAIGKKRSRKIDKLMSEAIERSTYRANNKVKKHY